MTTAATAVDASWRVYWPEVVVSDRPQALIGWRVGPRCLVVAALVPLEGAAERLGALGGSPAATAVASGSGAAGPCILGEYAVSDGSARGGSVDGGVWLVMGPGPRVRALYVCEESSGERPAPTIAVTLYRRSIHGAAASGLQQKGTTELDTSLSLMARAGRLQRELDGDLPAASPPTSEADCPPAAAPAEPPSPSLLVRSSLAYVQLRARGAAAWRVLWHREPSSSSAGGAAALVGLAVDSLLGAALGLVLCRHGASLGAALGKWHRALLHPEALVRDMAWLASDPGGFKLNLPLTQRLGAVVVVVAQLYTAALQQATAGLTSALPPAPHASWAVAAGTMAGATTLLALGFDVLRALTGHVAMIHASIARVYRLELGTLASLGRLFRGRKRNVLRRRVDSCEYSTQQLLLGTLLFTVTVALFPTLAAFHALCTALHLSVRAAQAGLWLLLVLLRDLPLHGLVLRLVAPDRFLDLRHVARCSPCPPEKDGGDGIPSTPAIIQLVGARKAGSGGGATGAGNVIADTEEGEGGQGVPEPKAIEAKHALLRLEYGRVPWARLFDGYARTARALRKACPRPGRAVGGLLTGALLVDAEGDGEGQREGEGRPPRPVFLQYRSLPQMLVEAAWASSHS